MSIPWYTWVLYSIGWIVFNYTCLYLPFKCYHFYQKKKYLYLMKNDVVSKHNLYEKLFAEHQKLALGLEGDDDPTAIFLSAFGFLLLIIIPYLFMVHYIEVGLVKIKANQLMNRILNKVIFVPKIVQFWLSMRGTDEQE